MSALCLRDLIFIMFGVLLALVVRKTSLMVMQQEKRNIPICPIVDTSLRIPYEWLLNVITTYVFDKQYWICELIYRLNGWKNATVDSCRTLKFKDTNVGMDSSCNKSLANSFRHCIFYCKGTYGITWSRLVCGFDIIQVVIDQRSHEWLLPALNDIYVFTWCCLQSSPILHKYLHQLGHLLLV